MENGNRTRIKLLVSLLPGVHLRELQRVLGMSFNTTRYHVEKLAKAGEIVREEDGGFSRLYPPGIDAEEKVLFTLARGETDRKILTILADTPRLSNKQMCDLTGLAKSTVSEHLTHLVQSGILEASEDIEGGVVYQLAKPSLVRPLIKTQDPSLLKKASERFIDLWDF